MASPVSARQLSIDENRAERFLRIELCTWNPSTIAPA
jgi:hypothetical protein